MDGLFEQIIHSEKAALKRKNQLQELRQTVFATQEEVKNLQREGLQLKKELSKKVQELGERELAIKWLTSQEQIMKEQKHEMQQEIQVLETKQQDLMHQLEDEKKQFCDELSDFCQKFDLSGEGRKQREHEFAEQLKVVKEEEQSLKQALEVSTKKEYALRKLVETQEELQTKIEKCEAYSLDKTAEMCKVLQKTTELEAQHQLLSNIPANDAEFRSLQSELDRDKLQCSHLDQAYARLQDQLNDLHRQLWQKQLKQRRQQQQQQQEQLTSEVDQNQLSEEHLKELFSDSEDFTEELRTPSGTLKENKTIHRHIFKFIRKNKQTVEPIVIDFNFTPVY